MSINIYCKKISGLFFALLFILSYSNAQSFTTLDSVQSSMQMENIEHSFLGMNNYFLSKDLIKSETPFFFPRKANVKLPEKIKSQETIFDTGQFIDSSGTQGLLVVQDDTLVYENYWRGQQAASKHIAWSMSKSYVSALFGIAMEEGFIESIHLPVDHYLPEMKGSGYEGVKVKDVLEMSSGIRFVETYSDPTSDIYKWWNGFINGESQNEFATTLVSERKAGEYNHYVSLNTHVLGMIIVRTTGRSLTDYMQEKIWTPIGAEFDAYWLSDRMGMEMALGGLNASLRDYAKLGQLYLQKGKWNDKEIVPADWIKESTTPSAPHLQADSENSSSPGMGYAYQWWIPEGEEQEIMAIGVFNQYIYINPTTKTVIVKNGANKNYYDAENPYRSTLVHLELFRAIANTYRIK